MFGKGIFIAKWQKWLMIVALSTLLGACTEGFDGRDGRAYLALTYSVDEPEYIDAGTGDIPEYFYWDEYYRVAPGYYTLYYDGFYDNGHSVTDYAWEVDYDVYVYEGEPGGPGYHGADAPDSYFWVECNPFGPFVFDENRKSTLPEGVKLLVKKEDSIVIEKKTNGFGLRATYRKVEPRKR